MPLTAIYRSPPMSWQKSSISVTWRPLDPKFRVITRLQCIEKFRFFTQSDSDIRIWYRIGPDLEFTIRLISGIRYIHGSGTALEMYMAFNCGLVGGSHLGRLCAMYDYYFFIFYFIFPSKHISGLHTVFLATRCSPEWDYVALMLTVSHPQPAN